MAGTKSSWDSHSFPVGIQNHMAALENILAAAYKVKIGPISPTSRYLPKRDESIYPYIDLFKNVHNGLILNNKKLETANMPINRLMYKQSVWYIHIMELITNF